MKELIIKDFLFKDLLGSVRSNVEVFVDDDYDPENFVEKGDFALREHEVERLSDEIVKNFLRDNFVAIQRGERGITGDEVRSIITYMRLDTNEQFGNLVQHSKSTISRINRNEEKLNPQACISVLFFLHEEYQAPGYCRRLLGLDASQRREDRRLLWANNMPKLKKSA